MSVAPRDRTGTTPARSPTPRGALRIPAIACSDPARSYSQREVLALLGLEGDEFAQRIFRRAGVQRRQLEFGAQELALNLQARTALIENRLLEHATRAMDRLDVDPAEIGTLVTSTLYSLAAPTLAHRLVEHYGMSPATDKYHVLGVGCASAVPLVRLAAPSVEQSRGQKAVIVAADLMSGILSLATPDDARAKTVASAIFGDGCAAIVLDAGAQAAGPAVVASKVHHIRGTLGAVRMELSGHDSFLHLDPDLPEAASVGLAPLARDFLGDQGLTCDDIEHWIVHPGGPRILQRVQEALSLSDEQVGVSYDVLANHGNTGTPTIFYVLQETIRRFAPTPGELGLMVTIGPGVTVGLMLLAW
ncbi:MAG TPA: 3-oxoacyl-[acyl-carrier-protein] synthase III C-terminal domain-containing protein [Solirubrobacteraceae bacterium]|jgi:alkylresorcinol/alkylpyrone synthase|nr:3-oxoacyl-[acyl-carrier-protein] synthase III C-terminal domain-containing protein [Solirubrobacteraceae bacterium]